MDLYSSSIKHQFESRVLLAAGNASLYSLVYLASNKVVITDGHRHSSKTWFQQDFLKLAALDLTSQYCIFLSSAGIVFLFPLYIIRDAGYDTEWSRFVTNTFIDFYSNRDNALEDWLQGFGECVQRRRQSSGPENLLDVMCLKVHSQHTFSAIKATADLLVVGTQGGEVFVISPFEGNKVSMFKFAQSVREIQILRMQPLIFAAKTQATTYLIQDADSTDKKKHKIQELSNFNESTRQTTSHIIEYREGAFDFTSLCNNVLSKARGKSDSHTLQCRLLPAHYITIALWDRLVVVFSIEDSMLTANIVSPAKGTIIETEMKHEPTNDCVCSQCFYEVYRPLEFDIEKWYYTQGSPVLQSCSLAKDEQVMHVNHSESVLLIVTHNYLFQICPTKIDIGCCLWEAAKTDNYVRPT